jgi:hypothetical protein
MSSFASAAKSLNLTEGDALAHAQQIWTMLDEMAATSPEKYAAFIAQQRKEHDDLVRKSRPPQPKYAIATTDVSSPVRLLGGVLAALSLSSR